MPEVFDKTIQQRDFAAENIETMRRAYLAALSQLRLENGSPEERLALVDTIQQIARTEVFRNPEHMALLAVDWYRSRCA